MERGSNKHGPVLDEAMKHETEPIEQGSPASPRVEEWRDPEGWSDGEPAPDARLTRDPVERRSDIARYLRREIFPAQRGVLLQDATENQAPADVISDLERLPEDVSFANMQQIWEQLTGEKEQRF